MRENVVFSSNSDFRAGKRRIFDKNMIFSKRLDTKPLNSHQNSRFRSNNVKSFGTCVVK